MFTKSQRCFSTSFDNLQTQVKDLIPKHKAFGNKMEL